MLQPTVLDAFIAGMSTAFFGALVAGGAYLLKQQMHQRGWLERVEQRLHRFEEVARVFRTARGHETLKSPPADLESDADGP